MVNKIKSRPNIEDEEIGLGLTKANIIRRSYFFNKILIRRGSRLINLVNRKPRKKGKLKNNNLKKKKRLPAKYSRIVILMRPNNTFISLTNRGETNYLMTAGIAGFAGPKRSSPYSRHVVARIISRYVYKQGYENIDIYFNSRITRRFYFLFKGLIVRPYNVRYIARNKMVSHGFMRKKKKRR